jgi:hypothetical protein
MDVVALHRSIVNGSIAGGSVRSNDLGQMLQGVPNCQSWLLAVLDYTSRSYPLNQPRTLLDKQLAPA